jgi:hypothetical protein
LWLASMTVTRKSLDKGVVDVEGGKKAHVQPVLMMT